MLAASACVTVGPDYEEPDVAWLHEWQSDLYGQVGQPEDFVPVVIFLCSDAGAAYSGVMFNRHTYVQGVTP